MNLARVEILRVELEVAVGVLVDTAREQGNEDGEALPRDLLEVRVVLQRQALKAPAPLKLMTFVLCCRSPRSAEIWT